MLRSSSSGRARSSPVVSCWNRSGVTAPTLKPAPGNFIVRLRKYFEPDPTRPTHFLTVRGVGYRFSVVEPDHACPSPPAKKRLC